MALPQSVQAQLDAAEATLKGMNTPPQETPPSEQPVVSLEELAKRPANEPVAESNQPVPPVNSEPPAPEPKPQPKTDDPNSETWANRYRTLQGVFNAEVPKLQRANQELSNQVQEVLRRLDDMAKVKQEPHQPVKPVVDPADVETFGADLVDMVNRVAGRAIGDLMNQVVDMAGRVAAMEQHLHGANQAIAATAEDRFFDHLARAVPDWETVNQDPGFIAWLQEADPVYGVPRGEVLQTARSRLDAVRAVAVFNAFKATVTPPQEPAKSPSVEKQVSPRASNASPPPAPREKPILTQAQVAKFYDDVRRGVFRNREAEMQHIELVINEALAEGRVR